jgi:hypothetical protein
MTGCELLRPNIRARGVRPRRSLESRDTEGPFVDKCFRQLIPAICMIVVYKYSYLVDLLPLILMHIMTMTIKIVRVRIPD